MRLARVPFIFLSLTQQHTLSGFNWEGEGTCGPCWSALSAPWAYTTAGRKEQCATRLALSPSLIQVHRSSPGIWSHHSSHESSSEEFCNLVDICQRWSFQHLARKCVPRGHPLCLRRVGPSFEEPDPRRSQLLFLPRVVLPNFHLSEFSPSASCWSPPGPH